MHPTGAGSKAVSFRPLGHEDLPRVAQWFGEPEIARWWNGSTSVSELEATYGPRIEGRATTTMWVVEVDGEAAGLAQHYRHADHPQHDAAVGVPDAVGIDYLIDAAHAGRGLGAVVVSRFAAFVLELVPDAEWCVATPARGNRRSWRALEAAGFRRMGSCEVPGEPPGFIYGRRRGSRGPRPR